MSSPLKRKRAVPVPVGEPVTLPDLASIQLQAAETVLATITGHLVYAAPAAKCVETVRGSQSVYAFTLADSTGLISGQLWREEATTLGERLSRVWSVQAEKDLFAKVTFRKLKVAFAKNSSSLRIVRGDRSSELQITEPCPLLLQPKDDLFTGDFKSLCLGPVSIKGFISDVGEIQPSASNVPMRMATLTDGQGETVGVMFHGENAESVLTGPTYIWHAIVQKGSEGTLRVGVYDESFVHPGLPQLPNNCTEADASVPSRESIEVEDAQLPNNLTEADASVPSRESIEVEDD